MKKPPRSIIWQAVSCIVCVGVLWMRLDNFGASEFRGGRVTGPLFTMADLSSFLFIIAFILTFFLPRIASGILFAATLACLPFYLYILMPGALQRIFKGEYSVPLQTPFICDTRAATGVLSLLIATIIALRNIFTKAA